MAAISLFFLRTFLTSAIVSEVPIARFLKLGVILGNTTIDRGFVRTNTGVTLDKLAQG